MTDPRLRLDEALVARSLAPSRSRARDAVRRGMVAVNGAVETRAARKVGAEDAVMIDDPASAYVARSALKLIAALDAFDIAVEGLQALDVGASTGGFSQVLLERGAAHVTAIDVGHDQLHPSLRNHPRLSSHDGVNARALDPALLPRPADLIVVDVSFISLETVLPAVLACAAPTADVALLVKPQFEVGREGLGKGGLVRHEVDALAAVDRIADLLGHLGWRVPGRIPSPLPGGDGNKEWLIGAHRG